MKGLFHFLQYHNAVPIALGVLFIGAGATFAATNPQAIYSSSQQVVSVDNTYIANKDLSTWTPQIQITGVTEDSDNYYIAYNLSTIDIVNYVWQDVVKQETLTVSKSDLAGRDLGVYATGLFHNIIANELSYLGQVQTKARQQTTQETVATTYGGLIGKMLTESTQTLPGYTPVVQPPQESSGGSSGSNGNSSNQPSGGSNAPTTNSTGSTALLSIQILGNNPATLVVGSSYADLGAVIIDPTDPNIGYHTFVDGVAEDPPNIDTSATSTHTIEYRVTDQAGNTTSVTRIVNVVPQGTPIPSNPTPAPSTNTSTQNTSSPSTTSTSSSTSNQTPSSSQSTTSTTSTASSTTQNTSTSATSTSPSTTTATSTSSTTATSTTTSSTATTTSPTTSSQTATSTPSSTTQTATSTTTTTSASSTASTSTTTATSTSSTASSTTTATSSATSTTP